MGGSRWKIVWLRIVYHLLKLPKQIVETLFMLFDDEFWGGWAVLSEHWHETPAQFEHVACQKIINNPFERYSLRTNTSRRKWRHVAITLTHSSVSSPLQRKYTFVAILPRKKERIYITRGLWTAMPALIEVKETDKIWHFYVRQKVIQNWGNFMGKRSLCVRDFNWKARKNCQLSESL